MIRSKLMILFSSFALSGSSKEAFDKETVSIDELFQLLQHIASNCNQQF
jgi:hypothetical protein